MRLFTGLYMSEKNQSSALRKRIAFSSYHLRRKNRSSERLTGIKLKLVKAMVGASHAGENKIFDMCAGK